MTSGFRPLSAFAKGFQEEYRDSRRAVKDGMTDTTNSLKKALRSHTERVLGQRMGRTWAGRTYPTGRPSLEAATYIYSKAPAIIKGHEDGSVIRARSSRFLAIPTESVPRTGRSGKRLSPSEFEQRTGSQLQLITSRRGQAFLILKDARFTSTGRVSLARDKTTGQLASNRKKRGGFRKGAGTAIMYLLRPIVRLRKKLKIQDIASRYASEAPARIAKARRRLR